MNGMIINPAHAYLLEADEKRGRSLARVMAGQILCELGGESRKRFEDGNAPDDIRVEEDKVSIDQVRSLIREMALAPIGSQYKVISVFHAGQMGEPAQNALLKSLEEPPDYVVWILLTDNRSRLLPTIRSRCQLRVPGLKTPEIEEDTGLLSWLVKGLEGKGEEIFVHPKDPLFEQDPSFVFSQFFLLLQALLDYQIKGKWNASSRRLSEQSLNVLATLSQKISQERLLRSLEECQKISALLELNINSQMALEHFMLFMGAFEGGIDE